MDPALSVRGGRGEVGGGRGQTEVSGEVGVRPGFWFFPRGGRGQTIGGTEGKRDITKTAWTRLSLLPPKGSGADSAFWLLTPFFLSGADSAFWLLTPFFLSGADSAFWLLTPFFLPLPPFIKISPVAQDYAVKGLHFKVKSIELRVVPRAGGVGFEPAFSSQAKMAGPAIKEAEKLLAENATFRQQLLRTAVRAEGYLRGEGSELAVRRAEELRQVRLALEALGGA